MPDKQYDSKGSLKTEFGFQAAFYFRIDFFEKRSVSEIQYRFQADFVLHAGCIILIAQYCALFKGLTVMNSNYVTDIAVKITHSADISTAQAITEIAIIMKLVSRLSLASSHELSVAENAEAYALLVSLLSDLLEIVNKR